MEAPTQGNLCYEPVLKTAQHVDSKPIPDRDIFEMYARILPLLYYNPESLDLTDELNKLLREIVPYDSVHYLMDASSQSSLERRFAVAFEEWGEADRNENATTVSMASSDEKWEESGFDKALKNNYEKAIERRKLKDPSATRFHYHRLSSDDPPRVAVGFIRSANLVIDNSYTKRELAIFDQLSPHILLLFRTALNHIKDSQAFQYFQSFSAIGTGIADRYKLSDTEAKLLPDILFGYSNEEIGERHFISIPTVKTHINHILKKTRTKNRVDFISKFFTSPEHVQL